MPFKRVLERVVKKNVDNPKPATIRLVVGARASLRIEISLSIDILLRSFTTSSGNDLTVVFNRSMNW